MELDPKLMLLTTMACSITEADLPHLRSAAMQQNYAGLTNQWDRYVALGRANLPPPLMSQVIR